jgi:hypothetical protein
MSLEQKLDAPIDEATSSEMYAELESLDREWLTNCEKYVVHGKRGRPTLPGTGASLIGSMMVSGLGVFMTLAIFIGTDPQAGIAAPPPLLVRILLVTMCAAFTILTVVFGYKRVRKAIAFERALAAYEMKRKDLTRRLGLEPNDGRLDYANFDRRLGAAFREVRRVK